MVLYHRFVGTSTDPAISVGGSSSRRGSETETMETKKKMGKNVTFFVDEVLVNDFSPTSKTPSFEKRSPQRGMLYEVMVGHPSVFGKAKRNESTFKKLGKKN